MNKKVGGGLYIKDEGGEYRRRILDFCLVGHVIIQELKY